jgi:GMP synthase PP-ATPase subunit
MRKLFKEEMRKLFKEEMRKLSKEEMRKLSKEEMRKLFKPCPLFCLNLSHLGKVSYAREGF